VIVISPRWWRCCISPVLKCDGRSLARYPTKVPDKAHKGRSTPVDVIVNDIILVGVESKSVGIVVVGEGNGRVALWRRQYS